MIKRGRFFVGLFITLLGLTLMFWPEDPVDNSVPIASGSAASDRGPGSKLVEAGGATSPDSLRGGGAVEEGAAFIASEYPIVAPLNRPDSTVARDLEVVSQVLDSWRSNFPRLGNPVGENVDITAALTGRNSLGLVLIPRTHPAINAAGELCDRWGTPFRFHQVSGSEMEIRSAGPDRRFGTDDDAGWNPVP